MLDSTRYAGFMAIPGDQRLASMATKRFQGREHKNGFEGVGFPLSVVSTKHNNTSVGRQINVVQIAEIMGDQAMKTHNLNRVASA